MKKVIGYIRKGSGKRDEERQRKAIEAYCLKSELSVIDWTAGDDFDGVAYGNWSGNRKVDAVVAASNGDVTGNVFEFYAYRCKLGMRGVGLYVADWKEYAGYGIHRKIFEEFTNVLIRKEMEHEPIRNAGGRMRKAAQGRYIGGKPPMGYKVEDGRLVVNPEEVPVVKFIMDEKRAGRTMTGTVEKLNASGFKTRNGGKFVISTVQGIWNNEKLYCGYYRYKKDSDWIKGQHEAIIEEV